MTDNNNAPKNNTDRYISARSLQTTVERLQQQLQPIHNPIGPSEQLLKILEPSLIIKAALEQSQPSNMQAAEALGKHLNSALGLAAQLESYKNFSSRHESFFSLPAIAKVREMIERLNLAPTSLAAHARQQLTASIAQKNVMLSLTQPWLREGHAVRSVSALLELQGIGSALRSSPNFDPRLTTALRKNLGDWREPIELKPDIAEDPEKRTAFYIERGFNSTLTDFPEKTFEETLDIVGLDTSIEGRLDELYSLDPADDAALRRTNYCHNHLQKLERRLRQFIHNAMTAQYGEDWPNKKLPPEMRTAWEQKRTQLEKHGTILTFFIEVSDFTDYEKIICRKDLWREVFQPHFLRKESVIESFQRLYPIRLATMHGRLITSEDLLYLVVENTRLMNAVKDT